MTENIPPTERMVSHAVLAFLAIRLGYQSLSQIEADAKAFLEEAIEDRELLVANFFRAVLTELDHRKADEGARLLALQLGDFHT